MLEYFGLLAMICCVWINVRHTERKILARLNEIGQSAPSAIPTTDVDVKIEDSQTIERDLVK